MKKKHGDLAFPKGRKKTKVPDLDYLECASCGEKVFDFEQHKKIEAILRKNKDVA
jgi:YgiT-type zinc finger domain-containing protein